MEIFWIQSYTKSNLKWLKIEKEANEWKRVRECQT